MIKYHDLSYFNEIFDFSKVENKLNLSIYFISLFLFATTFQTLTFLAIFYFSPTLIMVTDIISPMLLWIALTIKEGEKMPEVFLKPIGYLIVLFSALIYNEILIFNFCDLNKNTKKFVNQRLNMELEELKKNESLNDIDDFDSIDNDVQ